MASSDRTKRQRSAAPDAEDLLRRAREMWRRDPDQDRSVQTEEQEFRNTFGCGVLVALTLWNLLITTDLLPSGGTLEHLLWTLSFMKLYTNHTAHCIMAGGVDHKTFQKWVWAFIAKISELESILILMENRFKLDKGNDCLMTVDGTDFQMPQLGPQFSSHKFNKKSGLRYEVGLCILTGDIVWINGPYECGTWNDIKIFRDCLKSFLSPNERVEADDGYIGEHPQCVKCPKGFANPTITEYMQQRVRNRQETVNRRFKGWGILKQVFRHVDRIVDHGDIFRSVAIIEQLAINQGERLFECGYRDPPYGAAREQQQHDDDL